MNPIEQIEARREAILQEMRQIRGMRRGTINEQHLMVRHKGRSEPVVRGPYYVLSRREGHKTVSRRLTSAAELQQARRLVAEHRRFTTLCQEFERLTEKLGELEQPSQDFRQEKKRLRSPSSRTGS